jgi:hypothetical protein
MSLEVRSLAVMSQAAMSDLEPEWWPPVPELAPKRR